MASNNVFINAEVVWEQYIGSFHYMEDYCIEFIYLLAG